MADLRLFFVQEGYQNVATYIASGNIVFDSELPPDVPLLEDSFEDEFGFRSEVFLRDEHQVRSVLDRVPWKDGDGAVEVSFLERPAEPEAAAALEATAVAPEWLAVSGIEVFFLRVGKGVPTTHKETASTRLLDMKMTRRGVSTVRKISERFLQAPTK